MDPFNYYFLSCRFPRVRKILLLWNKKSKNSPTSSNYSLHIFGIILMLFFFSVVFSFSYCYAMQCVNNQNIYKCYCYCLFAILHTCRIHILCNIIIISVILSVKHWLVIYVAPVLPHVISMWSILFANSQLYTQMQIQTPKMIITIAAIWINGKREMTVALDMDIIMNGGGLTYLFISFF